jgi:YegS/Rv2252/BmrU family lipid kinase
VKFVVYNPRSAGGRTGGEWDHIAARIRNAIGSFEAAATRARDEATLFVREAVTAGASDVIAVGGDGTINEAINGLFRDDLSIPDHVSFGFVAHGTGGDFRRTFRIAPGVEAACARLADGATRRIDLGRVTFVDDAGRPALRHFNNIASLGLSGATSRVVNDATVSRRLLGERALFHFHSVKELLRYRFPTVGLKVDGVDIELGPIATVVVANGRYFGGGMLIAPDAKPDDGMFEVIIVRGKSKRELIAAMNLVYTGAHVNHPAVRIMRGRRIEVAPIEKTPARPIWLETDGESPGRLPARFEILPKALTLRC